MQICSVIPILFCFFSLYSSDERLVNTPPRPPRGAKTCLGINDTRTTLFCERWNAGATATWAATASVAMAGITVPPVAPYAGLAALAGIAGLAATSPVTAYCMFRSQTPLEDMNEGMRSSFLYAQSIKNTSIEALQAAMMVAGVVEGGKATYELVTGKPAFVPIHQVMTRVKQNKPQQQQRVHSFQEKCAAVSGEVLEHITPLEKNSQSIEKGTSLSKGGLAKIIAMQQDMHSATIAETFEDKLTKPQLTSAIEALYAKHKLVMKLLRQQFQQQVEQVNQKIPIEERIIAAEYRSKIAHEVAEKLVHEQIKQSGGAEQVLPAIIQTIPASTLTNVLYNATVFLGLQPSRSDDFDEKMKLYNFGKNTLSDNCPQKQVGALEVGIPLVVNQAVENKSVGGVACMLAEVFGLETEAQQIDRKNREYREQLALQTVQEETKYCQYHGLSTLEEARERMQQEFQQQQLQQQMEMEKQQAAQKQQIIKAFETQTRPKQFDLYANVRTLAEKEVKHFIQIGDAKRTHEAMQKMQHIAEGIAEDLVRADPKYKAIFEKKNKITASERKLINEKKVEILDQLQKYAQEKIEAEQSHLVLMKDNGRKVTPEEKASTERLKAALELKEATRNSGGGNGPKKNGDKNAKKATATVLTAKAIKEAEEKAKELAQKKRQQNIVKVSKKDAPNRTDISPDQVRKSLNDPELKKLEQQCAKAQKNDGKKPGTWEDIPGMNAQKYEKLEVETTNKYEALRHTNADVEKIANNTGIPKETIKKVKDHVFNNEHIRLDHRTTQEVIAKFDTNIDMIQAWERLQSGNYMDADLELIKHEFAESLLMGNRQVEYSEAHQIADMFFNWFKSLKG